MNQYNNWATAGVPGGYGSGYGYGVAGCQPAVQMMPTMPAMMQTPVMQVPVTQVVQPEWDTVHLWTASNEQNIALDERGDYKLVKAGDADVTRLANKAKARGVNIAWQRTSSGAIVSANEWVALARKGQGLRFIVYDLRDTGAPFVPRAAAPAVPAMPAMAPAVSPAVPAVPAVPAAPVAEM